MKRVCFSLSLLVSGLVGCGSAAKPFDLQKCQLQIEAQLASSFKEEAWRLEKNYYPLLIFSRGGDADLLSKHLKQNGYFQAATDPNDPGSKYVLIFSSDGTDQRRREMAAPKELSRVACQASLVSGARLQSVNVISGYEPAFKIEPK